MGMKGTENEREQANECPTQKAARAQKNGCPWTHPGNRWCSIATKKPAAVRLRSR